MVTRSKKVWAWSSALLLVAAKLKLALVAEGLAAMWFGDVLHQSTF